MPRWSKSRIFLAALLLPLVLFAVALPILGRGAGEFGDQPIARVDLDARSLRERGEYLAAAGNCASCHTAPGGEPMAGGLPFHTPFGVIYSTNITPDDDHGIGRWSDWDFLNSMRHGIRPGGEHLYPVFPYTHFTRVTNEDLLAIYHYLRDLEPIAEANQINEIGFPFNVRALMGFWKALFFEAGVYRPDTSRDEQWNRGAYLVEGLAHCSACHSPRNLLGAELSGAFMGGGEYTDRVGEEGLYRPWSAPNLTASERGLANWEHGELADYLHTARNAFLDSFGPMNEVIMNSTRHLERRDVEAMAIYLKTLPAVDPSRAAAPEPLIMGRGRTVYNLHCGTCHLPTGEGDPEMGPRLNRGSLVVQAENPAAMINVILYGPEAPHPPLESRWRKPMEEFQYQLDDEEIAAVATFVRHSWDNAAGVVTPEQVARQR